MATYKKRGAKKTLGSTNRSEELNESKTAEVFDSLMLRLIRQNSGW